MIWRQSPPKNIRTSLTALKSLKHWPEERCTRIFRQGRIYRNAIGPLAIGCAKNKQTAVILQLSALAERIQDTTLVSVRPGITALASKTIAIVSCAIVAFYLANNTFLKIREDAFCRVETDTAPDVIPKSVRKSGNHQCKSRRVRSAEDAAESRRALFG